jgi:hypothetical protein
VKPFLKSIFSRWSKRKAKLHNSLLWTSLELDCRRHWCFEYPSRRSAQLKAQQAYTPPAPAPLLPSINDSVSSRLNLPFRIAFVVTTDGNFEVEQSQCRTISDDNHFESNGKISRRRILCPVCLAVLCPIKGEKGVNARVIRKERNINRAHRDSSPINRSIPTWNNDSATAAVRE